MIPTSTTGPRWHRPLPRWLEILRAIAWVAVAMACTWKMATEIHAILAARAVVLGTGREARLVIIGNDVEAQLNWDDTCEWKPLNGNALGAWGPMRSPKYATLCRVMKTVSEAEAAKHRSEHWWAPEEMQPLGVDGGSIP